MDVDCIGLGAVRVLGALSGPGEIAARLMLGEATIKTHVSRIFAKLGLRDRIHAVVFAYEAGLVVPPVASNRSAALHVRGPLPPRSPKN
jgi:hypothetical protein